MGSKNKTISRSNQKGNKKEVINWIVLLTSFLFYALTFTQTAFYAATEKYVSLFVMFICGILFLNNYNLIDALKRKERELIILAALFLVIIINLLIVKSGVGSFFVITNFLLIWFMSNKIRLTNMQIKVMSILYLALFVYWVIFDSIHNLAYKYNTNTGATLTVFSFLCGFIYLKQLASKKEIYGLFIIIGIMGAFNLAMWHRARGAVIMLFAFIFFYYVMPKAVWKSKKFYAFLCTAATVFSIIFVVIYTLIGKTGVNFAIPFFYKNLFSGRQNIWFEFLNRFIKQPITGIGTGFEFEAFWEFNVHNAMLNILVVYGVIVFIGALYFIYIRLFEFRKYALKNDLSLCALCVIFAVFFESFFDIDLLWANYALNMIFLLAIANSLREDGESHEKV